MSGSGYTLVSFPGYPSVQMKVGRLVKFITWETPCLGRVDLNTFGRTNEFAYTLLMEYTHSVVTALLVTGRNSTMLNNLAVLQAMVSVQTRTFENHTNLLLYPSNWPLYTWRKHQDGLFPCMHLLLEKYARIGSISKHGYVYCRLYNYMHGHVCSPPTLNKVFSTFSLPSTSLMDKLLQTLSHIFHTASNRKLGGVWERG